MDIWKRKTCLKGWDFFEPRPRMPSKTVMEGGHPERGGKKRRSRHFILVN